MKILICGFSGAGKTTLLQSCRGNSLGYECLDLDDELANDFGIQSNQLGEWIKINGLARFRELEAHKIHELLLRPGNEVISLGGGALSQEILATWRSTNEFKLIFVDTPFDLCFERIQHDSNRILAKMNKSQLFKIYQERLPLYQQADLVLTNNIVNAVEGLGILESLVHNLLNPNS